MFVGNFRMLPCQALHSSPWTRSRLHQENNYFEFFFLIQLSLYFITFTPALPYILLLYVFLLRFICPLHLHFLPNFLLPLLHIKATEIIWQAYMLIALLDTAKKLQIYKNWVLYMILSALFSHNLITSTNHYNKRWMESYQ